MEDLSFNPVNFGNSQTAPEQHAEHLPQGYRCQNLTWCRLVFDSSDDESPVKPCKWHHCHSSPNDRGLLCIRAEASSLEHHTCCHHLTSTPNTEQFSTDDTTSSKDSTKENLPTAPLDDDVWCEDPILDRHLCIHNTSAKPPVFLPLT